jgi:glutamyl-tRNA reductase
MVIGENQIVGQLKDAYSSACAVKSAGKIIHRLFHQSFRVAKRVRTDTVIGKGACSVSTAAVEMLEDRLRAVSQPTVLFIGVNQTIAMAAKRVGRVDECRMVFANRTAEKAEAFAATLGAQGFGLDKLPGLLAQSDFVFSGTSSPDPIAGREVMEKALAGRENRKLVVVDLAIPRDFDVDKISNPSLEVNDLEDIKKYVSDGQHRRELAIPQAEEIIDRKLGEFGYWYDHVLHEPIYNGRSNTVETIREEELSRLLAKLPPELQNELNQATRRIVDRVIRITSRPAGRRSD